MADAALLEHIRAVLAASPFHGEGHRKVWARLRTAGIRTSGRRVLRLMREYNLLAPAGAWQPDRTCSNVRPGIDDQRRLALIIAASEHLMQHMSVAVPRRPLHHSSPAHPGLEMAMAKQWREPRHQRE
jgi:HTH-like domain